MYAPTRVLRDARYGPRVCAYARSTEPAVLTRTLLVPVRRQDSTAQARQYERGPGPGTGLRYAPTHTILNVRY
eukprot:1110707-Rhodomonas_salina.4